MSYQYDVIVIGGGPAGYVAAIRLAQLGKKTLLVEKRATLGGTCLNVGCIPTKVLLDSTEFFNIAKNHGEEFGVLLEAVTFDLEKIMKRKEKIVEDRCKGVDFLMTKNRITRIRGNARLLGKNLVEVQYPGPVDGSSGDLSRETPQKEQFTSEFVILATGSVPIEIASIPFDGEFIVSSDRAISLEAVPKDLVVIGAGAIGLELGAVWSRLGSRVRIIEMMPNLIGGIDRQMASSAQRLLASNGIEFFMEHRVQGVEIKNRRVEIRAVNKKEELVELSADMVLVAVGRKPYTEDLGLENTNIELTQNGRIRVDPDTFMTSEPGVYAIGDIIDGPMLAHKAEEEGVAVAEKICGLEGKVHYNTIASIVYTSPEIAWVGLGEDQLKSQSREYNVGRFLFRANARAHALNEVEGMVKILADKLSDKILGVFIVGPRASELIAEASLAMKYEATVDDIIHTVHSHPTLSEAIKEAALDVKRRAIHS